MDCFGTYFTHVQTCNVTRVQSATEWTASVHTLHMSKPVCNPCSKCYAMDCFGTYFTHVQTCNVTRVQSATQWTAPIWRLPLPVTSEICECYAMSKKKCGSVNAFAAFKKNSFSENIGLKKHKKPNKPLLDEAPPRSLWNNFMEHKPM